MDSNTFFTTILQAKQNCQKAVDESNPRFLMVAAYAGLNHVRVLRAQGAQILDSDMSKVDNAIASLESGLQYPPLPGDKNPEWKTRSFVQDAYSWLHEITRTNPS